MTETCWELDIDMITSSANRDAKTNCYVISSLAFKRNATRCPSVITCWANFNGLPVSMNLKSSNIVCICYTKHFFFKDFFFTCSQTRAVEKRCDWLISIFTRIRGVYKLQAWCSFMLQLLLFQSTERLLIDVESVRVATIGMEEILKLLTERDIEHTNNLPVLSSSYLHSPFPRSKPSHRARVNISLSLGLSHTLYPPYVPI